MNFITRWSTILLLCSMLPGVTAAQERDKTHVDFSFVGGIPHGAFANHVDEPALGIGGSVGGRVPGLPLVLFSEVGYLRYGMNDHLELTREDRSFDWVRRSSTASIVRAESNNSILMGHLVTRLQPRLGTINPYIDGVVGVKYFFTRTQVSGDLAYNWNELEGLASFEDLTFSFGIGGGVQVAVFKGRLGSDHRSSVVSLDLGLRYLIGPETEYLAQDAIRVTPGGITFAVERSRTDMLVPRLGIRIVR